MPSTFKYTPLNRQRNEVRLIELHPKSSGDSIHCTVRVQSLSEDPAYEALSYAWGESGGKTTIELNGYHFPVSTSLLSALQNIRDEHDSRTLWVDALSIDQQNDSEKEWQVSIMGAVFRKCSKGLLWVGEESEPGDAWCPAKNRIDCNHCAESDGACSYNSDQHHEIQHPTGKHKLVRKDSNRRRSFSFGSQGLAKCKHLNCRWHGKPPNISASLHLMESLEKNEHLYNIPALSHTFLSRDKLEYEIMEPLIALGALMSRSWWTRMWTVQEAALPPISTLCWGTSTYSLVNMAQAAEKLFLHSQNCCSAFFTNLIQRLDKLSCDESTVNALFNFQKHVHTLELTRKWIRKPGAKLNLMDCLYSFHDRKSKHPRDKIFACLGLLPPDVGLTANYEINVHQLYEKISLHLLSSCPDRSLSVLWRESKHSGSYPSWVKEFEQETKALNRRARSEHYHASNDGPIEVDCTDGILSLLGTKVDVLRDITENAHSASTYSRCEFLIFREWAQFLKLNERQEPYSAGVTWLDAFARTLSGDVHRLRPGCSGLSEETLHHFVQSLTKKKKPKNDLIETSLAQELNTSATGRKMFMTKKGRIGLGPEWMESGDEVWIFSGGSVPFILRPLSNRNTEDHGMEQPSTQKHHVVVGDCYVQGIMFGEAVSETTAYQHVFLK